MMTKEEFWQELSGLLGREVNPETDLADDPAIWDALPPTKKERVNGLLAIAMHSPKLMFSAHPIARSPADLADVELPLWKDVIPATPAGIARAVSVRPIKIDQLSGSSSTQTANNQNIVKFPDRLTSSQNFCGTKHKSYGIATSL